MSAGIVTLSPLNAIIGVLNALRMQISVSTVVEVLVVLATAVVGLAFMWWGVRKLSRSLMSAFKKGRIKM